MEPFVVLEDGILKKMGENVRYVDFFDFGKNVFRKEIKNRFFVDFLTDI